jgi:hypothetical protein
MLASGIPLAIKALTPSVVQVVVTDGTVHVYLIPNVYTFGDVLTICLLSVAFSYATFRGTSGDKVLLAKGIGSDAVKTLLKGDELTVYDLIRTLGPITQADVTKRTGFSKAKLSVVLDVLEAYGLIARRRRGRENVVTCT